MKRDDMTAQHSCAIRTGGDFVIRAASLVAMRSSGAIAGASFVSG